MGEYVLIKKSVIGDKIVYDAENRKALYEFLKDVYRYAPSIEYDDATYEREWEKYCASYRKTS